MKDITTAPARLPLILPSLQPNDMARNNPSWMTWFDTLRTQVYPGPRVKGYVKASLITANGLAPADVADSTGTLIVYVTDAAGGASTAYSDGTNWISHKTGAAV